MKVGEVVEKISELKSRKAIATQIVMYLQAHYLSSDVGTPEMRITRDDCHMVPEDHIKEFIVELSNSVDETDAMRTEFESFMAMDPVELQKTIRAKTKKKGGKNNGSGTDKRGDQASDGDPKPKRG